MVRVLMPLESITCAISHLLISFLVRHAFPFPPHPDSPSLVEEQSLKPDHFPSRGEDLTVRKSVIEGIYQFNAT